MYAALQQVGRWVRYAIGLLSILIVVASFLWVLSRPLRVPPEQRDQVELTVLHWSGGGGPQEDQIIIDLIAEYERRNPDIRIKRINPGDAASLYTKLQTMMAADTPPDLFYLGSERISSLADKDLLMPLEPLIEADRAAGRETLDLDDFYTATVDCFRYDGEKTGSGTLYGIPKDFTTVGFYYNKSVFDRAGIPYPPDDWTWQEFIETARRIGRLDGVVGAEFVTWPSIIRGYLWTYGVDVASPDFSASRLREPEVVAALEQLRSWRFDETGTLTSGKSQVATGEDVFVSGRVGMAGPFGRWVVPRYRVIEDFEWDFAPLPRGTVKKNLVFTVAWSMAANSRHTDESWDLLKFLTGADGQAQAARLGLAIPTLKSVSRTDAFIQPDQMPLRDEVYLRQAEYADAMIWPGEPRYESMLGNKLDEALLSGNLSLAAALDNVEAEWARIRNTPLNRTDFPAVPWSALTLSTLTLIVLAMVAGVFVWLRGRGGFAQRSEENAGLLMVSPWILGFAAFMAFPIALSLLLAFTRWNGVAGLDTARWVGLENFRQLLGYDPQFWASLRVTLYYALFAVPGGQVLALLAALLLVSTRHLSGFFRSAWYLPSVLAGVGVAILWRYVFDGEFGLMNAWLLQPLCDFVNAYLPAVRDAVIAALNLVMRTLGYAAMEPGPLTPPQWFVDDAAWFGPPAFAIMSFWTIGGTMVIYLAGLQGIPRDLYEAASIDGSGPLGRFRNITLPMLSPVIFFNFIMAIIGSFQVFTQAYVMTGGKPGDTTRFYVLYLFNQAFEYHEMGYASAMAWILLLMILGLTLFVMRGTRRYVYYEALK